MAFDPQDRTKVYVGGYNGGLYVWDANSSSWNNILSNIDVYDFAISPVDSKTIYAAGLYEDHGRLVVTTDGGNTWNQIFDDPSQDNPVRAVVVNPANLSEIVIGLGSGSVIKSADGGMSWQLAKDFGDRVNRMVWQDNNLYVLLQDQGLYLSSDFGQTFNQLSSALVPPSTSGNSTGGLTYNQFYVDTVTPDLIYITTSDGLYKSTDGGTTWTNLPLPIQNGNSVSRAIAVAQTSSNIVFTNVGSTVYKTLDGGATWQTQKVATNGIINYILIDPQLPQIDWAGIYGSAN
jgi:photosystem II stability/assembly factor-like uncharacterized protein